MSYSKKINPILKLCPFCGRRLTFGSLDDGINTSCKCGFEEAPGSLYILQHLSDVVSEYTQLKGITTLQGVGQDKYSVSKGFALGCYGYLSILQKRNEAMVFGASAQSALFQGSDLFSVVESAKGVLGERLCMNMHDYEPDVIKHLFINQLISLTYVIDETMNISKQSSLERSPDTIYIEDVKSLEIHLPAKATVKSAHKENAPSQLSLNNTDMGMN
ncbi:hypothetical protein HHX48_17780 [Salinimonas sp. HHU 13199]|uniref:Uncharacterized protein n=1 Tax=Salinimonas profundi TaxID=2729140 RepID=A0ABR8LT44_9ALTE|nr:hypothetical protein [Salinimonas profundi]MBD3587592.1 hypothetical protein [Salinimonas profundi]